MSFNSPLKNEAGAINPTSKGILGLFFIPLSLLYGAALRLRLFLYSAHIIPSYRINGVKIISIGNITAGGTGKTPVAILIAKMIGANVAVVSRGYGRRSREKVQIVSNGHQVLEQFPKASDEALVCAQELENIPVICSPKRINGIAAASLMFGAKTVILDDAFSHLSAWRDVNILLIDASDPFGGGRLLPAGYLREPLSSANRADAIIITRANLVSSQELERVKKDVSAIAKKTIPFFLCDISPTALVSPDMAQAALKTIEGRKVALLSAIGSPAQFEKTVGSLGATVVSHRSFRDHHPFSTEEIQNIVDIADKDTMLLTTQKDFVRIPPAYRRFFHQLKIEARIREANEFANFLRT